MVDFDPEPVPDVRVVEGAEAVVEVVDAGRVRVDCLLDGVPLVCALLDLKLDELLRVTNEARNALIGAERLPEKEIEALEAPNRNAGERDES